MSAKPLVVQYLFVDGRGRTLPPHPSVRTSSVVRYLECALTQSASLRLAEARCDIALATNLIDRSGLKRRERALLERIESLGVQLLPTEFRERPGAADPSARFVRDVILRAVEGQPGERELWIPNLDCVWIDPQAVFAATPAAGAVGCIFIAYPVGWSVAPPGTPGATRRELGVLAASLGGPSAPPPWIGADLLAGTCESLRELVATCEALDARIAAEGPILTGEQQVLTLAGALGSVQLEDLAGVARRIHTGPRHESAPPAHATELGLWHLPAEKGLSLRRAASSVLSGRTARLRGDLADPERAAKRFNVGATRPARRIRDDGWIALQRARASLRPGGRGRSAGGV
jgi:hypothetical protein